MAATFFPFFHFQQSDLQEEGGERQQSRRLSFRQETVAMAELTPALKPNQDRFFQYLERDIQSGTRHNYPFVKMSDYKRIYQSMATGKELGGTFSLGKDNSLTIASFSDGQTASVDVPLSPYEFHTHPNTCNSKKNCALGVGSVQDLSNILERSSSGNICHFVFAIEGVFVIKVRRDSPDFMKRNFGQKTLQELKRLQVAFAQTSQTYKEFREEWLQVMNNSGCFEVDYFPLGVGPYAKPPSGF
jgi:hypothetical protein